MSIIEPLGFEIYQVNLIPIDQLYATTCYIIKGENRNVIIETGAPPANAVLIEAMASIGLQPGDIDGVIGTHIHLDHTGGAGKLMSQCQNATMYIHEKGKIHLADPEKIVAGTRVVYGDTYDTYFGEIMPIPAERVETVKGGDEYDLGGGRKFQFFDAPGHALHHVFVFDPLSKGIFSGDAAGIYYAWLDQEHHIKVSLPSTTPTQYDPEAMHRTLDTMALLKPDRIYYTHFGMGEPASELIASSKKWIQLFDADAKAQYLKNSSVTSLNEFIQKQVLDQLESQGVPRDSATLQYMTLDNEINSQGIAAYVTRLERMKQKAKQN